MARLGRHTERGRLPAGSRHTCFEASAHVLKKNDDRCPPENAGSGEPLMTEIVCAALAAAEDSLLGNFRFSWAWADRAWRRIFMPALLLNWGVQGVLWQTARVVLWGAVGAAIALIAFTFIPLPGMATQGSMLFCGALLGLGGALFPMPSELAGRSSLGAVEAVVGALRTRSVNSVAQVDVLRHTATVLERRSRARVSALRWLLAGTWAAFMFALTRVMDLAPTDAAFAQEYVKFAVWALFATVGVYTLARGYAAPVDRVFDALHLGMDELQGQLITEEAQRPVRS